ncbi:MAG: alpha-glucan family phosphorylase [Flavobacteriales bacterium]|nr:alpha-glucan family phosphorylase [Flavobacteriales bacterium]
MSWIAFLYPDLFWRSGRAGRGLPERSERLQYRYDGDWPFIPVRVFSANHFPSRRPDQQLPPSGIYQAPHDPCSTTGEWLKIGIDFPGRTVYAKAWMLPVGRIPLYLLDTDIPENSLEDRMLTHQLYGGDTGAPVKAGNGVGDRGIRLLAALGEEPEIFHCNEGHAAFMGIERLRQLLATSGAKLSCRVKVGACIFLFTTHTPVPAGHDYFSDDLLRTYLSAYVAHLGIGWDTFLALGKINPYDGHELFSMSHLAIRLCQEVNGVSRLHGKVSQQMFKVLYPGYNYQELYIGYVTNGVHTP